MAYRTKMNINTKTLAQSSYGVPPWQHDINRKVDPNNVRNELNI